MGASTLLFNPAAATTDELESLLVGRDEVIATILEDLEQQRESQTTQHFLLIGPRGTGKTHLTEILSRRLASRANNAWRTVRLPEESFSVDGLDGLISAIVDRDTDAPRKWDSAVPDIDESLHLLAERTRLVAQPLLVILENLPRVLRRVLRDEKEIGHFRSILMSDPPFTLVCTATSYFEGVTREDRPLYDFFRVINLHDLTGTEVEELIVRRARWDNIPAVVREMEVLRRRVRAIHHLSGGNPRLVLALYEVLRAGVSEDIHRQFLDLLDRVTPYYQARLDDVSRQQGVVLSRLARAPRPLAAAKLGKIVGLSTSHTTAVLDVLLAERLVRRRPGKGRGRSRYGVTDRLFRIWLEMRESRGASKRLRLLIDFFKTAYTRKELQSVFDEWCTSLGRQLVTGAGQGCSDHALTIDYISDALELSEGHKASSVLSELRDNVGTVSKADLNHLRAMAQENRSDHPFVAAALHVRLADMFFSQDHDAASAERELVVAASIAPTWRGSLLPLWHIYLHQAKFDEAFRTGQDLNDPDDAFTELYSAMPEYLRDVDRGLEDIRRIALQTDCPACRARRLAGFMLTMPFNEQTLDKEIEFLSFARDVTEDDPYILVPAGVVSIRRGDWAEASQLLEIAVEADPEVREGWAQLACAKAHLGEAREFLTSATRAMSCEDLGTQLHHMLSDLSPAFRGVDDPGPFMTALTSFIDAAKDANGDLSQLYEGLWRTAEGATPEWTATYARLYESLTEESHEPWQSFVAYVEGGQEPSDLDEMHPEIREAVELLLSRHGITATDPPLMRED